MCSRKNRTFGSRRISPKLLRKSKQDFVRTFFTYCSWIVNELQMSKSKVKNVRRAQTWSCSWTTITKTVEETLGIETYFHFCGIVLNLFSSLLDVKRDRKRPFSCKFVRKYDHERRKIDAQQRPCKAAICIVNTDKERQLDFPQTNDNCC